MKTTITVEFNKRVDRVSDLMDHIDAQCSEDENGASWAKDSEYIISVKHSLSNVINIYGQEFVFTTEDGEEIACVSVDCHHLANALVDKAKDMGYNTVDYFEDDTYTVKIKK